MVELCDYCVLLSLWWIWTLACKNRLEDWYFHLGEWLSPKRNYQRNHPCSCAKSRLGELESLKRDLFSSKRASLAWARVRPSFYFWPLLESRLGEIDSPEQDGLSPRLDYLAWARPTTVVGLKSCFNDWSDKKYCNYVQLLSCML